MESNGTDSSAEDTRTRAETSVPLDFISMIVDGNLIAGSVDGETRRCNRCDVSSTARKQQARNAFYHHQNGMIGVIKASSGQHVDVEQQQSKAQKPGRRVTFADEDDSVTIDTSGMVLGSVNREARTRSHAVARTRSLRPSISAPGRIQRTRLTEDNRRAKRVAELARRSSAARAESSRRKAADIFGVDNLPKNSLDGPALLPEHATSSQGKYQVFVEERTVKRQGSRKLRLRPVCQERMQFTGVSCRSQAQPGEYLPQLYRTQTTSAEVPQLSPRSGSLRKRHAHTLTGCGHVIYTKKPSSCAGNCACGFRSGRVFGDSVAEHFEHPCIHCVKERLQQERLRNEHIKIDEHRSRVAEDVLSGFKELEKGRDECARFAKDIGRVWLAEINVGGQTALVNQLVESIVPSALDSEYEMGDMNKLKLPSVSQTNRISDYRGQERSMDLLNRAVVGLRNYASTN
ncbi:MAG: hypothetical protein M1831_005932 [Alyxoria varia]|nr:MAG: hypothetical protein M1831_005932 [Alyxoria varia]